MLLLLGGFDRADALMGSFFARTAAQKTERLLLRTTNYLQDAQILNKHHCASGAADHIAEGVDRSVWAPAAPAG